MPPPPLYFGCPVQHGDVVLLSPNRLCLLLQGGGTLKLTVEGGGNTLKLTGGGGAAASTAGLINEVSWRPAANY